MPETDLSAEMKAWLDSSARMPESFTIQKPSKQPATFLVVGRDADGSGLTLISRTQLD